MKIFWRKTMVLFLVMSFTVTLGLAAEKAIIGKWKRIDKDVLWEFTEGGQVTSRVGSRIFKGYYTYKGDHYIITWPEVPISGYYEKVEIKNGEMISRDTLGNVVKFRRVSE